MKTAGGRRTAFQPGRRSSDIDLDVVAMQALLFLADDPERLGDFLSLTGLRADGIRDAAREPVFLHGVLAYLNGNEELLVAFARGNNHDPERLGQAIQARDHERATRG